MTDNSKNNLPLVTIGMPVYNGSHFIRHALDSILDQTFTDFELIISDNASTDNTQEICQEYLKDKRIRYIRQEKNLGAFPNFYFVLKDAKGKYFMWAATDDFWEPTFLEKNLDVLKNNSNVVCSISKIGTYDVSKSDVKDLNIPTVQYPKFIKNYVMNRRKAMIQVSYPVSGTFEKKLRHFLKNTGSNSRFYGLYRTQQIKDCFIQKPFIAVENAIFINLLKMGDLYEVDEELFYRFISGWSTYGIINMTKQLHGNLLGIIFPFYPFTLWCLKNIGIKNILKNIDLFTRMNVGGLFFVGIDFILKLKNCLR